jgi:hypothetical protein
MIIISKDKTLIALLLTPIIIGVSFFPPIYEYYFLAYYQEPIADKWANYFLIPLFAAAITFTFITKYREYGKIIQSIKTVLLVGLIILFLFYSILHPAISGAIIFINANIGSHSKEIVEGLIIDRRDYSGRRYQDYSLTIQTNSEVLIFQTDYHAISNHHKGENLRETMYRGSLGLLFKK